MKTYLRLAPNAVVILNHLCYSAGNSEPGAALPSKSVARQRIDNYGAPFLKIGAKAVFAEARNEAGYILNGPVPDEPDDEPDLLELSEGDPDVPLDVHVDKDRRSDGHLGPVRPSRYYRSVVGKLTTTATAFR